MDVLKDRNVISRLDKKTILLIIKETMSKERLIEKFMNMNFDISDLLYGFKGDFNPGELELTEIDDKTILTYKNNDNYYIALKEGKIRAINIKYDQNEFTFAENGIETDDIAKVKEYVDLLAELKRDNPAILLYDTYYLYQGTDLICEYTHQEVIQDEKIILMLPYFRDKDDYCLHLDIVIKDTKESVGYIEFRLSEDNFAYIGNVEYTIKERFRKKRYATRALALVKKLVSEYGTEVDKTLYITTVPDNIASQGVIFKNGGKLFYEGKVPLGDKVRIYNKVDYVKIYKIDANTLQE